MYQKNIYLILRYLKVLVILQTIQYNLQNELEQLRIERDNCKNKKLKAELKDKIEALKQQIENTKLI